MIAGPALEQPNAVKGLEDPGIFWKFDWLGGIVFDGLALELANPVNGLNELVTF